MSLFKFLGVFGAKKTEQGAKGLTQLLASWDPDTASEVDLKILKDKQKEYASLLVKANQALDKDLEETNTIQGEIKNVKSALSILKEQHQNGSETAMDQARSVRSKLDELQSELEREQQEDAQARQVVDAYQKLYDQITDCLQTSKAQHKEASRRLDKAKADKAHQDLMNELNNADEGIGQFNIALNAMNEAAEKMERNVQVDQMTSKSNENKADRLVDDLLKDQEAKKRESLDPFSDLD